MKTARGTILPCTERLKFDIVVSGDPGSMYLWGEGRVPCEGFFGMSGRGEEAVVIEAFFVNVKVRFMLGLIPCEEVASNNG